MVLMEKTTYKLTPQQIAAAERVLNRGDRVELVPLKDGVKVLRTKREEVKPQG